MAFRFFQFSSFLLILAFTDRILAADELLYVQLGEPCRLLDTRASQGGSGVLTAAHGNYLFGTSDTDIESAAQHGNSAGCGLPASISAVSVAINQLDTTASGNIRAWSSAAGSTGPAAGTAVYNPSIAAPRAGEVLYNGAYSTISVGTDGRFFLSVANGQLDMTINVIGYWRAVDTGSNLGGDGSVSFGSGNMVNADYATAIGASNTVDSSTDIVIGSSNYSSAGNGVTLGFDNINVGQNSIVMGYYAYSALDSPDSFVFNDGSAPLASPGIGHVFWVRASNGAKFYSSADKSTGVTLAAGSGSWTAVSDRHVKDAVVPVDGREVLDRVASMPLATWHYKAQDAKYRHMGPMAQDFYAAFGLGESDTGIDTIDADGVALAAIQGLNAKLESTLGAERAEHASALAERDRQIAELRAQVAELAAAIRHPISAATP